VVDCINLPPVHGLKEYVSFEFGNFGHSYFAFLSER